MYSSRRSLPIFEKMVYILVILILIVLAMLLLRYSGHNLDSIERIFLGAAEQRSVLVFTNGSSAANKQLKSALSTVETHIPVYNPAKLSEYSNVPVIWTGTPDIGTFLRAHPGVCGGAVLWHPSQMPTESIPESTFVVQDLSKQGTDASWEQYSHHRYYVSKAEGAKYIQEILHAIR